MAIFKNRLPSRHDLVLVYAVCAFPIYTWTIYHFLEKAPGWLYYLELAEVASIFAYTQTFALIESALVFLGFVLVAALAPPRLLGRKFVAVSSALVLLVALWTGAVQYHEDFFRYLARPYQLLVAGLCLGSVALLYLLIDRYSSLERMVISGAERLSVLLYLYLPLSAISIVVVILRNLS